MQDYIFRLLIGLYAIVQTWKQMRVYVNVYSVNDFLFLFCPVKHLYFDKLLKPIFVYWILIITISIPLFAGRWQCIKNGGNIRKFIDVHDALQIINKCFLRIIC